MEQMRQVEVSTVERALVSVILAVYNEARCIEGCIHSILEQRTSNQEIGEFDIEVLAVDGMSNDGTLEILARCAAADPRVRVVANEKRRTPFAFNLGLLHARGEYVCIFGAHSIYRNDYIATCLGELAAHDAAGCGGRVLTAPAGKSLSARLCAWTMSHPFGSSRKSFRTQQEGPVDTVNYPVLRRSLVLAAGGYDEELLRNQDNDLNQKLRAGGYTLWCTWKTQCVYFPKATVPGLLRYAFGNGYWNIISLEKNPAAMGVRHFVPLVFVLCLLASGMLAVSSVLLPAPYSLLMLLPLAVLLAMHLSLGILSALQIAARERSIGALWLPAIFLGFHFAYGYGALISLARRAWAEWVPKARPAQSDSLRGIGKRLI